MVMTGLHWEIKGANRQGHWSFHHSDGVRNLTEKSGKFLPRWGRPSVPETLCVIGARTRIWVKMGTDVESPEVEIEISQKEQHM